VDVFYGGPGEERFYDGKGQDEMIAGNGDDFARVGPHRDQVHMLGGADRVVIVNDGVLDVIDCGAGNLNTIVLVGGADPDDDVLLCEMSEVRERLGGH
jgi:hypothetical protein